LDGAAALHKQEEDIYRELGDKVGMQFSRVNQGAVLQKRGDLDGAMALYRATEQGCRELGDSEGVATSLANQAWVCGLEREEFDRAIALAEQALLISSSHGYRSLSRDITTILERIEARRSVHSPGSSTRNV
jgi:tetratricopeptide (TPR) repeat protein